MKVESGQGENIADNENSNQLNFSDVDGIANDLIDNMPDVSEHVVNAHFEKQNELEQNNATVTDKRGDSFNPDMHAVNDQGEPKLTAGGYFAKKRGRKGGGSTINVEPRHVEKPADTVKIKQRAAGAAAAGALMTLGVVIGGEEWQPIINVEYGVNEKANLENAFAEYFEARGLEDIPPNIALIIAISGYVLPRFTMPKTKKRTFDVFSFCKKWWINRKLKKHNLKVTEAAKEKTEVK